MSPTSQRPNVPSAFGKVPAVGDFLRTNAAIDPIASFDTWVTEGMASGESRRGEKWAQAYGTGSIQAFVFRPPKSANSGNLLAGVLRPSHDAVGRKYPLVVCTAFEARLVAGGPHLLPLVLGDFFEGAAHALLSSSNVTSQAYLEQVISPVPMPRLDTGEAAYAEYQRWAQSTPLLTAWGAIYGTVDTPAPAHAIYTIIEALRPFRGQEQPVTPLSVRLPLGEAGVAAAAFWIDVVRSAAKWRATVPTFFWSFDGSSGSILIQLGDTPISSLVELWSPDPESDHVCDLTSPKSVDPARFLGQMPPAVAQALQSREALAGHLLAALAT